MWELVVITILSFKSFKLGILFDANFAPYILVLLEDQFEIGIDAQYHPFIQLQIQFLAQQKKEIQVNILVLQAKDQH